MKKATVIQSEIAGSDGSSIYYAGDTVQESDINDFEHRVKSGALKIIEDQESKIVPRGTKPKK